MFKINNDDLSISLTRGDTVSFDVSAKQGEVDYTFEVGDRVVFKVSEAKNTGNVILEARSEVTSEMVAAAGDSGVTKVTINLTETETKLGTDVISKPVEFWYELALENDTEGKVVRQTLIGYDDYGAKILRLLPEIGTKS